MSNHNTQLLLALAEQEKRKRQAQLLLALAEQEKRKRQAAEITTPTFADEVVRGMRKPIDFLAQAMSGVKPPEDTAEDTLGSRIGGGGVEALMTAVPLGAAFSKIQPALAGAGKVRAAIQGAVSNIGQTAARRPYSFAASETVLGGASGAGGYAAEQLFPNSDAARFVGEILGGGIAEPVKTGVVALGRGSVALARRTPVAGAVFRTWDEIVDSSSAVTAGARAAERTSRALAGQTPESAIAAMDEPLLPAARQLMTPAQLSNVPGLLSLEKSVINSTDTLREKSENQLAELNNILIDSLSRGSGEGARDIASNTRSDYFNLLNASVRIAAQKTDEQVTRMIPELGAENANRIARKELNSALDAAVKQEKEFFDLIDGTIPVSSFNTSTAYRELEIAAGIAGKVDLPVEARRLFGKKGKLKGVTTVSEMRTAQSMLRGRARAARVGANPNYNQARMYDNVADAITDDLAEITEDQADVISNAVSFSRQKNEVFRQGEVGKILRGAADSGDVIVDALTLTKTLGLNGPAGAQAYDEIWNAVNFAASQTNYQTTENMASAMEDFVKNEFIRRTVRNGVIDPKRVETFLRNNEETLRRLPALASDIAAAASARTAEEAQTALMKAGIKAFDDPLTSKAALLINKGPTTAFKAVFSARNPVLEMRKLVDMVNVDATGEGLEGLKAGVFTYLLDNVTDTNGIVSGESLTAFLKNNKNKAGISQLLSREEMTNLEILANTARRVDSARGATESLEGITRDKLSFAANTLLRLGGAFFGREVSTRFAGGNSLVIPAVLSSAAKQAGTALVLNPARRLLIASLSDEQLFRNVVLNAMVNRPLSKKGNQLLHAWALDALAREGYDLAKQEEQEKQQ